MKASEFIKNLQELIDKHGDLELVYSSDEEGNSFDKVYYEPSVGMFDKEDKTFIQDNDEIAEDEDDDGFEINAFCIN